MAQELSPIDITSIKDFPRLIDEVHDTGKGRRIQRDHTDLAILQPELPKSPRRRTKTVSQADVDAALAASWQGLVDPEQLKQELDEARGDSRSSVSL